QMPSSAINTGIFSRKSLFRKCSSIFFAPDNNSSNFPNPIAQQIESPTGLQRENRPPTHSHIGKILDLSIPNFSTALILVETATKCFSILVIAVFSVNQDFAVRAFVK